MNSRAARWCLVATSLVFLGICLRDWGPVDAQGCFELGLEYHQKAEKPTAQQFEQLRSAAKWYRKAAELGHTEAQLKLGLMYQQGEGPIRQDYEVAAGWIQRAAEAGHAEAQFQLGWLYSAGTGVLKDKKRAAEWYRKAAEQSHAAAQWYLGLMYFEGDGVTQDRLEAMEWCRKAKEQKYPGGAFSRPGYVAAYMDACGREMASSPGFTACSEARKDSRDVPPRRFDYQQTLKKTREAANRGEAEAQRLLGIRYFKGDGVELDPTKALVWIRKAADQGHAGAQLLLAEFYRSGVGVEPDEEQARAWTRKAAEGGEPNAQYQLGLMLLKQKGGSADDLLRAVDWFRKAAQQGMARAQIALALQYYDGLGVASDKPEAVRWFRKAAEQGNATAQCNLGWLYANGMGTDSDLQPDLVQAYGWSETAARNGAPSSEDLRGRLEKDMTAEQIAEAQTLSTQYWEKYVVPFQEK